MEQDKEICRILVENCSSLTRPERLCDSTFSEIYKLYDNIEVTDNEIDTCINRFWNFLGYIFCYT